MLLGSAGTACSARRILPARRGRFCCACLTQGFSHDGPWASPSYLPTKPLAGGSPGLSEASGPVSRRARRLLGLTWAVPVGAGSESWRAADLQRQAQPTSNSASAPTTATTTAQLAANGIRLQFATAHYIHSSERTGSPALTVTRPKPQCKFFPPAPGCLWGRAASRAAPGRDTPRGGRHRSHLRRGCSFDTRGGGGD